MSQVPEGLWELLQGYLQAEDLELDDLEMVGQGRGVVLRVTVDMNGGVGVDRLAETARGLSRPQSAWICWSPAARWSRWTPSGA